MGSLHLAGAIFKSNPSAIVQFPTRLQNNKWSAILDRYDPQKNLQITNILLYVYKCKERSFIYHNSFTQYVTGPKRCPKPLDFDVNDPTHLDFIVAGANLKAKLYSLEQVRDRAAIAEMVKTIDVPQFTPKAGVTIATSDAAMQAEQANADNYDGKRLETLQQEINSVRKRELLQVVKPIEFEKDDDTNFHMDFIVACSNLRAANYSIAPASRYQSKLIAGKIIPAIATATSVVSGLASLEVYKHALG